MADRERDDGQEGIRGRELIGALVLLTVLGALYVAWKYLKHNWLVDQGYLPEGMRNYWMVFAFAVVALIAWAAKRRFRL